jgi:hypothetical protein
MENAQAPTKLGEQIAGEAAVCISFDAPIQNQRWPNKEEQKIQAG